MIEEQKRISAKEFVEKVEAGWKVPALKEYFGIPAIRVREYLKQLGLRIKSTKGGGSILVMDIEEEPTKKYTQMELPFKEDIKDDSEAVMQGKEIVEDTPINQEILTLPEITENSSL